MEDTVATTPGPTSRFELAPPRHFILPAILLLLSERPGYGYGLVPQLREFRFGHVDRPAVYRALAQLEHDGLVEATSQNPTAGQARRVYHVTRRGEQVLRVWMGVIKEEHDHLGGVLRRYQATGTTDAALAEVEGGWALALGSGWSPISPTAGAWRRLMAVDASAEIPPSPVGDLPGGIDAAPELRRYRVLPDRSVVLIEVRSTVGPLSFGAIGVTGEVDAATYDNVLRADVAPSARLEIDVSGLSSGNSLYDAELHRRIDARRYPITTVELRACSASGPGARYRLSGDITFHGVTRSCEGTVHVEQSEGRLLITGEQVFDIRDFAIPLPTVLMLRIYPDIRVRLHAEAELEVTA